jgi:hypothetical protein
VLQFGKSRDEHLGVDKLASIRQEVLDALNRTIVNVRNSLSTTNSLLKYKLIWQSYSQAELAVGLSKLGFSDQINSGLGSFRDLGKLRAKLDLNPKDLTSSLTACRDYLERSLTEFQEGKAEKGLESARVGRDILRLLLLEEKRPKTKRKKKA